MHIQELQLDPIPSPSKIEWQDIGRILVGGIPESGDLTGISEAPAPTNTSVHAVFEGKSGKVDR